MVGLALFLSNLAGVVSFNLSPVPYSNSCSSLLHRFPSTMPCGSNSSATFGCLYAFLKPHRARWDEDTIAMSWRSPRGALPWNECDPWSSRRIVSRSFRGRKHGHRTTEMFRCRRGSTGGSTFITSVFMSVVAGSRSNGKMDGSAPYRCPPSFVSLPVKRDTQAIASASSSAGSNGRAAPGESGPHRAKVARRPPHSKNNTDNADRASVNRCPGREAMTDPTLCVEIKSTASNTSTTTNSKHDDSSFAYDHVAVHETHLHENEHYQQPEHREQQQPPPQIRKYGGDSAAAEREMLRLGKARRWRDALDVLASIPAPYKRHYLAAISACDWSGQPRQALRLHGLMVAAGIPPSPRSLLPVVRGLLYSGDACSALRVFQNSGVRLRIHGGSETAARPPLQIAASMGRLYTTVIRAAQKIGDWREAVLLYREAELLDPGPSADAARTVFLACYAAKQYAAAASFASEALRPPWKDIARQRMLMNKVIVACGRAGPDHYRQALDTFENLERTVGADGYTLTAVVDVLRRLGDWQRALRLLERLAALGVPADRGFRTSINAVLSTMGPDNYREARKLAARAAEEWGVEGDVVTFGTLLLAASEHLLLLPALSPLEPQPDSMAAEVRRGSIATSTLPRVENGAGALAGTVAGRDGEVEVGGEGDTVQILRMAAAVNAVPSESCLNMVMFGLARSGRWEEAAAFVEEVERAGRRVSRNQREALVAALCVGERWREALSAVETMLAEATVLDNATAGLAMKAYANVGLRDHWRDALSLMKRVQEASVESMSQDAIDASSWRCLLSGLAREGLDEEAAFVMREMVDAGIEMDEHSGAALIFAAYATGDHEGALAWVTRLQAAELPISLNGYVAAVDACFALGNPNAAIGVLESIAAGGEGDTRVSVPGASVYNAVLQAICRGARDSAPRKSSRAWDGQNGDASIGVELEGERSRDCGDRGGGRVACGGIDGRVGSWGPDLGTNRRVRHHPRTAAERAESAMHLFVNMARRGVPAKSATYALVVSALLEAERVDDVVDLWTQAWSDPGVAPARRNIAQHILCLCREQGRGPMAVRLLEIGARLAAREETPWPEAGSFRAAIQACEREGAAKAWSAALSLLKEWDAKERRLARDDEDDVDGYLLKAVSGVVDEAAAEGAKGAIEASATLNARRRKKRLLPPDLETRSSSPYGGGGES